MKFNNNTPHLWLLIVVIFSPEEKPLLYEYYANTLNPIIDRRGILGEEADSHAGKRSIDVDSDRYTKRFFLERSRTLPTLQEQQQQKQQIVSIFRINYK